jgi:signal transduction histidine kinase
MHPVSTPSTDLAPAQARRLLDLCVALNTIHDPDLLLQLIIETATDILDCEAASLLLYDDVTGRLRFEAATGLHADALAEIFVPLDQSIAGTIFRENRALLVDDAEHDERHFKGASEATGLHTQILLGVPMRIEGTPVGVLEALNPRRGAFTEADVETLSIVSAQAAVAIQNARQRQALRVANDRLARIDQLKNDFMAVASHELRTPVSIVLGFGTVLRDESYGHLADMATDVMAAGERMQEIIETFEEMSAIQAESIELKRHPLELQQVLREAWARVGVETEIEHARLVLPDVPLWVHGDYRRLLLVFEALLKNACTFTPTSGSVELALTKRESNLFATLRDTGCGLAEKDRCRIFEAFYQAGTPLTRGHEGLGVGLTIVEALVRLHDGHVWAESDGPGQGSTFHVRLPLYQP